MLLKAPVQGRPLILHSTSIFGPLTVDNAVDSHLAKTPNKPANQGYIDSTVDLPLRKVQIRNDSVTDEDLLYILVKDPGQTQNLCQVDEWSGTA